MTVRKGTSTESAALTLTSLVEGKRITCAAFLDIQNGFDAAWCTAFLEGLIDIRCPLYLGLIVSTFLSDRCAVIESGGFSILSLLSLGCPQGSVLSPFLWNILIEAVFKIYFKFSFAIVAYADYLLLLISWHRETDTAVSNLQKMFEFIVESGSKL